LSRDQSPRCEDQDNHLFKVQGSVQCDALVESACRRKCGICREQIGVKAMHRDVIEIDAFGWGDRLSLYDFDGMELSRRATRKIFRSTVWKKIASRR